MPSEDIRRTLEAYAEAWRAADVAAMTAFYDDGFILHYGGGHSLAGDHAGKTQALVALADFSRRTERRLVAIVDVLAGDQRGAIIARETFHPGDEAAELERLLVYAVQGGKLTECWVYDMDPALVARFVDG